MVHGAMKRKRTPDHELAEVCPDPGWRPIVEAASCQTAQQAESRRPAATGQRRRDTEERFEPDAEGEPDAEEGKRHLGYEVGHRPPSGPIAQRGPQPPKEPGRWAEWLGFGDLLAQHPPGERPLPAAEAPGGPKAAAEDEDPDEHDGEHQPDEPEHTEGEYPRIGKGGADHEVPQLSPAALLERLPQDHPGQTSGLLDSLLGDPDLNPASFDTGLAQVSRLTKTVAPTTRAIAA